MTGAIISQSYDSNQLAMSIHHAAVSASNVLRDRSGLYVIGNAADFDEYCEPIIEGLSVSGVSCLWPIVERNRISREEVSIYFSRYFIQPLPPGELDIVLAQSIVAVPEEIIAMLSLALGERVPVSVTVICCTLATVAENEIRVFVEEKYGYKPQFYSEESMPADVDRIAFRNEMYDRLDSRPLQLVPILPQWVFQQIKGTKLDKKMNPTPDGFTM
ncbi:hypothetical protein [Rhizobium sp. Leaf383]|uniref:hypothetical protein n=1 Tax=Rhizobium sp. Leaf383 TaxID=1736357 RepID=UPI0007133CB9|nr:hypothetical protein [Rhizobium sp. Leaf383]KQS75959.1 hypothetical protein ASG58_14125 [Rhizobium sp. Leaf383]